MTAVLLPWLHLHIMADSIASLTFHFQTQSGSGDGSHLACSAGQTPAKSSRVSTDGEDVRTDGSRKKKQQQESLWYTRPEINWASFAGRHSSSQNSCVCGGRNTQSIVYHISHGLARLSASGSPYYINGKCSVEDNTQMVAGDERWHPARD